MPKIDTFAPPLAGLSINPKTNPGLQTGKSRRVDFTKMVASGNDFVLIDGSRELGASSLSVFAKNICDRKYGVGADGLLILEKSKIADIKMRIFNPDGSEAEMCGNGARCAAYYLNSKLNIETKAGIIESELKEDNVRIKLINTRNIRLDIPIKVNKRNLKANFINTGVPHAVIFVEGLDEIHVSEIGRVIRNHKRFAPRGTNVDFVEALNKDSIGIRTYERGVEDETLACGTGSVASALIFALKSDTGNKINVHTKGREILKVYFDKINNNFKNVWLEGKARIVCKGEYYV